MSAPVRSEWRTSARALVWADAKANYNGLRQLWMVMLPGIVGVGAVLFFLPGRLQLLPVTAPHIAFLRDAIAVIVSFAMLSAFSGIALTTPAKPLVQTLPLDKRAVWALFAARGTLAAVLCPGFALLVVALAPAGTHAPAFVALGTLAAGLGLVVLSIICASYTSLRAAGCARWLRWMLWGTFLSFALAPPVAFAITGDVATSVLLTGPGFLAAQAARAAADLGLVGAGATTVAVLAAGWLLAHAPPGARATAPLNDADGEGIRLPWPEDTGGPPPVVSFAIAGQLSTEEQISARSRNLELYRAKSAAAGDDGELEPLPVPFGLEAALRYHTGMRSVELKDVLFGVVSLGALAIFVYLLLAVPYDLPAPPVVGRPDPFTVMTGLWGFLVLIVAFGNAPGTRAFFRAQAKKEKKKKARVERKERPRPWASSIRQWKLMQTLPIDRGLMARVYFGARLKGVAAAAPLALVPFLVFQPPLWIAVWILLVVVAALGAVAGAAVPMLADTAVPREGERVWLWLRRTGQALWLIGGLLVPVVVLARVNDPLFSMQLTASQAALYALTACMAAAVPLLLYRTFYEELVTAQRPYDTPSRVLPMAATGAGMVALLAGLLAGI